MTTPDRVERSVHIAATAERVWDVLTAAEHVGNWFGQGTPAEVDLRPDGVMVLEPGHGERYLARVVEVDPPHYFAYRWASAHPGVLADESNSTLVEFRVSADGEGTRLTVSESGFAALAIPEGRERFASYESHRKGWTEVMDGLVAYAEGERHVTTALLDRADELFAALAEPNRRLLLERLGTHGAATATTLAAQLTVTRQAVTQHLAVLEHVELVSSAKDGRERRYTVHVEPLTAAAGWMNRVATQWDTRLTAIKALAEAPVDTSDTTRRRP